MQATIQNEFLSPYGGHSRCRGRQPEERGGGGAALAGRPGGLEAPRAHPLPVDGQAKARQRHRGGGKTYKGGQHGFARDVEHTLLKAEGDTIQLELRPDEAMKAEKLPLRLRAHQHLPAGRKDPCTTP